MQARFYAPWFGRFLSPDPARDQHFESTQSWNIYSYVQNDPTMRIDPTGMVGEGILDKIAGAIQAFSEWREKNGNQAMGLGRVTNQQAEAKLQAMEASGPEGARQAGSIRAVNAMTEMASNTLGAQIGSAQGASLQAGGGSLTLSPSGTAALAPAATGAGSAAGALVVPALASTNGGSGSGSGSGDSAGHSGNERTPQDRRLTKQEVKQLEKDTGLGAHEIKAEIVGNKNMSKYDLFKSKSGEVVVKLKNGKGPGEPTGYSL